MAELLGSDAAPRNLVVCCDGTGHVWGEGRDTNVVRLVRACVKDAQQVVYYDPGVGTVAGMPPVGWVEAWAWRLRLLRQRALGSGIHENIASAYVSSPACS